VQLLPLIKGIATWIPLAYDARRGRTGGTGSARYCYSVWLRHLVALREAGVQRPFLSVAELGPGDSLGIGLAAMLCGADRLQALDVVPYTSVSGNLPLLRELAGLFAAGTPIPGDDEFPGVVPRLADYAFPRSLLTGVPQEAEAIAERRARLEKALLGLPSDVAVAYRVPWDAVAGPLDEPVDLLYSQAVMEHVEHPEAAYGAMARWVVPGGAMSHVIDLRSHRLTPGWDGHLQYTARAWRLVKGARPYLLNRSSATQHRRWLEETGFRVLRENRVELPPTVARPDLAPPFRDWSDQDRRTSSVHFVAVRT